MCTIFLKGRLFLAHPLLVRIELFAVHPILVRGKPFLGHPLSVRDEPFLVRRYSNRFKEMVGVVKSMVRMACMTYFPLACVSPNNINRMN